MAGNRPSRNRPERSKRSWAAFSMPRLAPILTVPQRGRQSRCLCACASLSNLPQQLQSKLHLPIRNACGRDLPRGRQIQSDRGHAEFRTIEEVEELAAKLQLHRLPNPNREKPVQGEIHVVHTRPIQLVASRVPVRVYRWRREAALVEPVLQSRMRVA